MMKNKTVKRLWKIGTEKKQLGRGFIFCYVSVAFMVAQLIMMNRTAFSIIFLFLIPGIAVGAFAFHCLTFTENRPTMLILMPMSYLLSLLLNELIAVEVGAIDTYPYIPLVEFVPFFAFAFSVATNLGKKPAKIFLKIWMILTGIASAVLVVLTIFFNLKITHEINNIKATVAIVCGFGGVGFLYAAMYELIDLAGTKVNGIPFKQKRINQLKEENQQ